MIHKATPRTLETDVQLEDGSVITETFATATPDPTRYVWHERGDWFSIYSPTGGWVESFGPTHTRDESSYVITELARENARERAEWLCREYTRSIGR